MGKIADLSHYNGDIDWNKARKELDMVIFRASVGMNADKKYPSYSAECGLPYGVYHYVKAGSAEEARKEARFFVECAGKAAKKPGFYIADIEYEAQTKETTEPVCIAFLEELRALGCGKIGLYIGHRHYRWAGAAIDMCDIMWIPSWGHDDGEVPEPQYEPDYRCDLWQYTSCGSLAGSDHDTDLNLIMGGRSLEFFTEDFDKTGGSETVMDSKFTGTPTNLQLVNWMWAAHAAKVVYWYGTCFYKCSQSLYESKKKQYPDHYGSARTSGYMADIAAGRMCADCVGIIKGFFWTGGDMTAKNVYQSHGCPDKNADGFFDLCEEKGKISTIPDVPGIVVHSKRHIGVYVGGGKTIELGGFSVDCAVRDVTEGDWEEWGKLPESLIRYEEGSYDAPVYALGERELAKGDDGEDVKELQLMLIKLGYDLGDYGPEKNGADGDFGKKTEKAVRNVQADAGLPVTGVYDTRTHKALIEQLNPPRPDVDKDMPEGGGAPAYVLIIEGEEDQLRTIQAEHGGTLAAVDSVTAG